MKRTNKTVLLLIMVSSNIAWSSDRAGGAPANRAPFVSNSYVELSPKNRIWNFAQEGRVSDLQKLLEELPEKKIGIDLNNVVWPSGFGYGRSVPTPLMIAAENGHAQVVELLIQHRACVHAHRSPGCTAFAHAAKGGHVDVMRLLVTRYSNAQKEYPNAEGSQALVFSDLNKYKIQGEYACIQAIRNGHIEAVRFLIANGINVNFSYFNKKPLGYAKECKETAIAQLLSSHGARS